MIDQLDKPVAAAGKILNAERNEKDTAHASKADPSSRGKSARVPAKEKANAWMTLHEDAERSFGRVCLVFLVAAFTFNVCQSPFARPGFKHVRQRRVKPTMRIAVHPAA